MSFRLHGLTSLRRRHVEHAWPRGPCAVLGGRAEMLLGPTSTATSIVEIDWERRGETTFKARTSHSKDLDREVERC